MKRYTLEFVREPCISCGACEKLCPKYWVLESRNDDKADIKGAKITRSGSMILKETLELDELDNLVNIAKACPMSIIHIIKNKMKERLI